MFGKHKKPVGPAQAAFFVRRRCVFHATDRKTNNASKNSESVKPAARSLKLRRILSPFKEEQNPHPKNREKKKKTKEERMCSCIFSSSSGSAFNLRTLQLQEGKNFVSSPIRIAVIVPANRIPALRVRASTVDSSSDFARRIERAWLISQQPRPIVCSSCNSKGRNECKWCGGTGFFILGDNMLCEVPSRNTSCIICAGKGSTCCSDCHGTGYRAKWLEEPPTSQ